MYLYEVAVDLQRIGYLPADVALVAPGADGVAP